MILATTREAPRYGLVFGTSASRKWYAADKDYYKYVEKCNLAGVICQELLRPPQLIPTHIHRVLARRYTDGRPMDNEALVRAVQDHAGYTGRDEPSRGLAEEDQNVATMRPGGGSALSRVEAVVSNLENYVFIRHQAEALYLSADRKDVV